MDTISVGSILPYVALGVVAVLVGAALVAEWLKWQGRPGGDELALKARWAAHLVREVEKHLVNAPGFEKYDWVFEKLAEYFPDIDEGEAEILIESSLTELKEKRAAKADAEWGDLIGAGPAAGKQS